MDAPAPAGATVNVLVDPDVGQPAIPDNGVVGAAQPMVVVVYGQAPQNRMSALSSDTSSPALLGYALLGAMVLFAVAALLLGGLLFLRLRAVTQ